MEDIIRRSQQAAQQIIDKYNEAGNRSKQYDEENPYTFDEAQAKASASERFDPYYDAELNDYISGVQNTRQRSNEDSARLTKELTADTSTYVGKVRRDVKEAIDSAKEGFAGAGLYKSGARIRREGQTQKQGQDQIDNQQTLTNRSISDIQRGNQRTLQDLNLGQSTFERRLGADKTTNILTDVEKQRQDQLRQREFERQQFVGAPLNTGSSSLSSIYGI